MIQERLFQIVDIYSEQVAFYVTSTGQMRREDGTVFDDDPAKPPLVNCLHQVGNPRRGLDGSTIRYFSVQGDLLRLVDGPLGRWWETLQPMLFEDEEVA